MARVARKHGITANQVFQWRRLHQEGLFGGQAEIGLKLLPVRVGEEADPAKIEQVEARRS